MHLFLCPLSVVYGENDNNSYLVSQCSGMFTIPNINHSVGQFLAIFLLPTVAENDAMRAVNQNCKAESQPKNELKDTTKLRISRVNCRVG